jgi:two-component system response regulator DevR
MRIYLVEDSILVRNRLANMISELTSAEVIGYAEEASQAVRQITQLKPDVVVLDLGLRAGSGFQVLADLGMLPAQPTVIVLTNYAVEPFRRAASELGAHYFFDKSIEFEQVLDVIGSLAASRRRLLACERAADAAPKPFEESGPAGRIM